MITCIIALLIIALICSAMMFHKNKNLKYKMLTCIFSLFLIASITLEVYVIYMIYENTQYKNNMFKCHQDICSLGNQYKRNENVDEYIAGINIVNKKSAELTNRLLMDDTYKRLINPCHKGNLELFYKYRGYRNSDLYER